VSKKKRKKDKAEKPDKSSKHEPSASADGAQPGWRKSWPRDYLESVIIAVVLALFIRTFVVQTFKIPSGSMMQTLLVGDHILVNKFAFGPAPGWLRTIMPYAEVERGDVVVFKYPNEPHKDYIKRVVGLPGDVVQLCMGYLYVNGELRDEPFINLQLPPMPAELRKPPPADPMASVCPRVHRRNLDRRWNFRPRKVPDGHYLMFGDNRLNSSDSRDWGFVPRDYLKGRALLIYWSFEPKQAAHAPEHTGAGDLAYVALHFFDKTRWRRTFKLVR
jgi:signal peptidase I